MKSITMKHSARLLLIAALLDFSLQPVLAFPVSVVNAGYHVTNLLAPQCHGSSTAHNTLCRKSDIGGLLPRARTRKGGDGVDTDTDPPSGAPGDGNSGGPGGSGGPGSDPSTSRPAKRPVSSGSESEDFLIGDMGGGNPPDNTYADAYERGRQNINELQMRLRNKAPDIVRPAPKRIVDETDDEDLLLNDFEISSTTRDPSRDNGKTGQATARMFDDLGITTPQRDLPHQFTDVEEVRVNAYAVPDEKVYIIANIEKTPDSPPNFVSNNFASDYLFQSMTELGIDKPRYIIQDNILNRNTKDLIQSIWTHRGYRDDQMVTFSLDSPETRDDYIALAGSTNGRLPFQMISDRSQTVNSDPGRIIIWRNIPVFLPGGTQTSQIQMLTEFIGREAPKRQKIGLPGRK